MKFEFKLPDVGEGIHEAELLSWSIKPGDRIKEGQDIAVLNTDKVTVDLPSPRSGTVVSLHGKPGDIITVSSVLLVIEVDEAQPLAPASSPMQTPSTPADESKLPNAARVAAGPSVRRLARQKDVNLEHIVGTGPRGRILKTDVEAAAEAVAVTDIAEPAASPNRPVRTDAVTSATRTLRQRLSGARLVSARNLHDSVQRSVTTTTTFEVPGDGLRNLIASLVPEAQARQLKLSPLHIIAKCVGAALIRHERFNATVDEESQEIVFRESVDLGIAVATPDRLLVPVVRSVEQCLLFDLVRQIDDFSERARQGQLKVAELSGGSFTLSSTGGMERVTVLSTRPIINPPQTATLWVSRITDRPRVINGQLSAGPMLLCSLSFDHRYVDGAEAVHFINDLGGYLEHPERALG